MNAYFDDFSLYTIDVDYLEYLYDIDNEVFYDPNNNYQRKPFLGILINVGNTKKFIPLTSKKKVHATWPDEGRSYFLIYEIVPKTRLNKNSVYKKIDYSRDVKNILGALVVNKMIPAPEGVYSKIDINAIQDPNYKNLVTKEFNFLKNNQKRILAKADAVYNSQISHGIVYPHYVDFTKLEDAALKYNNGKKRSIDK